MKGTFAGKLAYLMNERHLSYRALTAQLGINKDQFTRWSQGTKPQWSNVIKLADFFGVDPYSLSDPGLDLKYVTAEEGYKVVDFNTGDKPDPRETKDMTEMEQELLNQFRALSALNQMDALRYILNLRDKAGV